MTHEYVAECIAIVRGWTIISGIRERFVIAKIMLEIVASYRFEVLVNQRAVCHCQDHVGYCRILPPRGAREESPQLTRGVRNAVLIFSLCSLTLI